MPKHASKRYIYEFDTVLRTEQIYWHLSPQKHIKCDNWDYMLKLISEDSDTLGSSLTWLGIPSGAGLESSCLWYLFRKLTCQPGSKGFLWTEGAFSSSGFTNMTEELEGWFLGHQDKAVTILPHYPHYEFSSTVSNSQRVP